MTLLKKLLKLAPLAILLTLSGCKTLHAYLNSPLLDFLIGGWIQFLIIIAIIVLAVIRPDTFYYWSKDIKITALVITFGIFLYGCYDGWSYVSSPCTYSFRDPSSFDNCPDYKSNR